MKTLEKGQDKLQKICEILRTETLEPAKKQAETIVSDAQKEAEQIIKNAEMQVERLYVTARHRIEQEKSAFQSSLAQATKQGIESLKQAIEYRLFSQELQTLVTKEASEPKVIAKLITALATALEQEGLEADLVAIIPKVVPAKAVVAELGEAILRKLKDRTVELGEFEGGAKIRLEGRKMTLDISDEVLKELLAQYIQKDFRDLIFNE